MLRLERTFQDLDYRKQRNVMISAFRKATRPTVEAVKSNAPIGATGNLRRSIGILTARNEIAVILGARKGKGFKGWHGHIVEEGTNDRYYTTKNGKRKFVGRMNPNGSYAKYFRRGIESTEKQVMNILGEEWYKAIDRYHRKNGLR